jgi:cobalt/nickel transport protein
MKRRLFKAVLGIVMVICFYGIGFSHFAVILPSDDIIEEKDPKMITLKLYFMHPFEQEWLNMEKPKSFYVKIGEEKMDLLKAIKNIKLKGKNAWETSFTIKRPGDHIFFLEMNPYWEEAEEKFLVHCPKVIVQALGKEDGWEKEVGLPIEIVPLTRPYGLWVGNTFRGVVKLNGKPLPFCRVEVEYYNEGKRVKPPKSPYVTQVLKTDVNGVFSYSFPKAGWWGFSAITEAPYKLKKDEKEYPVELGGIMWIRVREMR